MCVPKSPSDNKPDYLCNSLVPNKRQAIICLLTHTYVSSHLSQLNIQHNEIFRPLIAYVKCPYAAPQNDVIDECKY